VPRPGDLDDSDLLQVKDDGEPEVPDAVVLHDGVAHPNQVKLFDLLESIESFFNLQSEGLHTTAQKLQLYRS
jgi:hypothetical protein